VLARGGGAEDDAAGASGARDAPGGGGAAAEASAQGPWGAAMDAAMAGRFAGLGLSRRALGASELRAEATPAAVEGGEVACELAAVAANSGPPGSMSAKAAGGEANAVGSVWPKAPLGTERVAVAWLCSADEGSTVREFEGGWEGSESVLTDFRTTKLDEDVTRRGLCAAAPVMAERRLRIAAATPCGRSRGGGQPQVRPVRPGLGDNSHDSTMK
jgi:hypothetical protein